MTPEVLARIEADLVHVRAGMLPSRYEHEGKRPERRSEVRVRLPAPLKLSGIDLDGKPFEQRTQTENVSLNAFLCGCTASLNSDSVVNVFLLSGGEHLVGSARVIRSESTETPYPRYALRFVEQSGQWVLQ